MDQSSNPHPHDTGDCSLIDFHECLIRVDRLRDRIVIRMVFTLPSLETFNTRAGPIARSVRMPCPHPCTPR